MTATKSFTLRIPVELLDKIEKQAGEGKRSELIIHLLEKALEGANEEQSLEKADKLMSLELRVHNLENALETIRQEISTRYIKARKSNEETSKLPESIDIPDDAKKVDASEMLKTLKEFDPAENWNKDKLKPYRTSPTKVGLWHERGGKLKFTYAGKSEIKETTPVKHYWWIVFI